MSKIAEQTEEQTRESIKQLTEAFIRTHYPGDFGLFLSTWEYYKDLKLNEFQQVKPKTHPMRLSGSQWAVNVPQLAIQVLGQICLELRTHALTTSQSVIEKRLTDQIASLVNGQDAPERDMFIPKFISFFSPRMLSEDF